MIDAHCHVDLYTHPERVLRESDAAGLTIIAVTNLPSHYHQGLPHVTRYRRVRLALGLHPLLVEQHTRAELELFTRWVNTTSYIGEVGLDFSQQGKLTVDRQLMSFKFVLERIRDRPRFLTLHSRGAEVEVLNLLAESGIRGGVFHWYSGPKALIPRLVEAGHYFSINPAMILSKRGQEIIKRLPPNRVLTETDGPYLQVEGRPAIPKDVQRCYTVLATLWGCPSSTVGVRVKQNFETVLKPVRIWQERQ